MWVLGLMPGARRPEQLPLAVNERRSPGATLESEAEPVPWGLPEALITVTSKLTL